MPSRFLREMGENIDFEEAPPKVFDSPGSNSLDEILNVIDYKKQNKVDNKDLGLNIGSKVKHKKWGIGTVVSVKDMDDDKELVIAFDKQGLKKLKQSYAPIEVV